MGIVMVIEEIVTVPPDTNAVLSNVMSPPPPVVVTEPSKMGLLFLSVTRNHPAVPLVTTVPETPGLVDMEQTPLDGAPNEGLLKLTVASNVPDAVVAGVAGWEPV